MITSENLVQARYTDDARTTIECLIKNGTDDLTHSFFVVVDPANEYFQQLMTVASLEDIDAWSETYYANIREEIETVHTALIEAGKADYTRIAGPEDTAKQMELYSKMMFSYDSADADHVEKLFNLKLELFELDEVTSADEATRDAMRLEGDPLNLMKKLWDIRNP